PYVTAGFSVANLGLTYQNEGGDYYSSNTSAPGWLVGTGMEWVYNKNWSVRAEYSYMYYRNAINMDIPRVYNLMDPNGGAHAKLSSNNVTLSVNYWI
ncbi:MAG: outer membrane beta-barrel protein, partial [Gammaproteobacteria bacterium]|nr:outer membrane beta-barrel protein [Gammaproteobacteria bacterium]